MKKTVALLLGLMLILGFALVACGGTAEEETTTTAVAEEVTTTEAAAVDAVDWSEASDYEGSEATVTGVVAAVDNKFTEKGVLKILVRVGGVQTEPHFNIVVELNEDGSIPIEGLTEDDLNGWIGQTVTVTGTVVLNAFDSGAYEIFITDMSQVTVE